MGQSGEEFRMKPSDRPSKNWIRALAATLAGASMLFPALPSAAGASAADDQIAFAQQTGSFGSRVFVINPDGSGASEVPLVYPAEDFGLPIWSPNRNRLLISHVLRLDEAGNLLPFRGATVNLDGSDFQLLDTPIASFDGGCFGGWFPDASRVLCAFGGDQPGVYSIRASDGADPIRLVATPAGFIDSPTDLSPDGSQFVFLRYRAGPSHGGPRPFITEQVAIFIANIDGSGVRQLTPYGLAEPHEIAAAQWSPDGHQIISETTKGRLFVIELDRGGISPIDLQTGTPQYFAFGPDWSPDGTHIVFGMFINGQEDIYIANADGTRVRQVTGTPEFEYAPDWGPARLGQ
jgi:Tol biopolymer transport system component